MKYTILLALTAAALVGCDNNSTVSNDPKVDKAQIEANKDVEKAKLDAEKRQVEADAKAEKAKVDANNPK